MCLVIGLLLGATAGHLGSWLECIRCIDMVSGRTFVTHSSWNIAHVCVH